MCDTCEDGAVKDLEPAWPTSCGRSRLLDEMQDILENRGTNRTSLLQPKLKKPMQMRLCDLSGPPFAQESLGRDHGKHFQFSEQKSGWTAGRKGLH